MSKCQGRGSSSRLPSWSTEVTQPPTSPSGLPRGKPKTRSRVQRSSHSSQGHPLPIHQIHKGTQIHPRGSQHTQVRARSRPRSPLHTQIGRLSSPAASPTHHRQVQSHHPTPRYSHTQVTGRVSHPSPASLGPRQHLPHLQTTQTSPDSLRNVQEDVRATISRGNEAMALGSTETFADSFVDRTLRSPHRPDKRWGKCEEAPTSPPKQSLTLGQHTQLISEPPQRKSCAPVSSQGHNVQLCRLCTAQLWEPFTQIPARVTLW